MFSGSAVTNQVESGSGLPVSEPGGLILLEASKSTATDDTLFELRGPILVGSSKLKWSESWLGVYVKQSRGPIKAGFSTTHSGLRAAS